jgi:hypothetical protein
MAKTEICRKIPNSQKQRESVAKYLIHGKNRNLPQNTQFTETKRICSQIPKSWQKQQSAAKYPIHKKEQKIALYRQQAATIQISPYT